MGNMLVTRMMKRGARGVVTDGAFRDGAEIAAMDFPTWCAGSHRDHAAVVPPCRRPEACRSRCAGVAVYPGDVIHGDADNITVIPAHLAAEMAELCEAQDDLESYLALPRAGRRGAVGPVPAEPSDTRRHRAWQAAGPSGDAAGPRAAPRPRTDRHAIRTRR